MSQSLIFTVNENPEEVLIPELCPVPVRRSSHLTVGPDCPDCVVRVFLKNEKDGTRTKVAEVPLIQFLLHRSVLADSAIAQPPNHLH